MASAIARNSSSSATVTVPSCLRHSRQAPRRRRFIRGLVLSSAANDRSRQAMPHSAAGRKANSVFASCRTIRPRCKGLLCQCFVLVPDPGHGGQDAGALVLDAAQAVNLCRSVGTLGETGFQVSHEQVAQGKLEKTGPVVGSSSTAQRFLSERKTVHGSRREERGARVPAGADEPPAARLLMTGESVRTSPIKGRSPSAVSIISSCRALTV